MNYLYDRLREPSTWRGLVWVLTATGITLDTSQIEAITAAGMALVGLIGVFSPDKPEKSL